MVMAIINALVFLATITIGYLIGFHRGWKSVCEKIINIIANAIVRGDEEHDD
jgi:hypothetical protein